LRRLKSSSKHSKRYGWQQGRNCKNNCSKCRARWNICRHYASGPEARAKEASIKYLLEELGRQAEEHTKQLEVQAAAQASEIQAAQNEMRMLRRQAEEHRKHLEVQKTMQSSEIQAAQEQMRMLLEKLRQMEITKEADN